MTRRKPAHVSFGDWIEGQIRTAQDRGDFDDLPGTGKPIPAGAKDGMDWVAKKMREEQADPTTFLPPSLALAKEIEDLPARVRRERSEKRVRELAEDLNDRIRQAYREPQVGPPMRVAPVDVDEIVQAWRG
ncbi:uncharacterized protein DUF1992 [Herbihabitans rhizosphaerae]|uniref:Uncharacterized protein DUF1992 n=1 Tax=Herbihabitans rhizosphaerae TaxID=1872711 RepID=A0A4Q7KKH4_9PSEU|nr:DUF1992 domain-containing protein [Herbihabitans rhizosphaerae]RZS34416.1 uncharacterized protein DUF1992 [Herbihabitans rhizosphaerae]